MTQLYCKRSFKLIICSVLFCVFPAYPAFAGMKEAAVNGFVAILNSIATGISSWMFKYLQMFIMNATDLDKLGANLNYYIGFSQVIGIAMVVYFTTQNLFLNMIKVSLGEQSDSIARILGRGLINLVMVVSITIILNLMLDFNNWIVRKVTDIGIVVDKFNSLFTAPVEAASAGSDLAILFLILVIAALCLAIVGGIRFAEIAFLYIIAPILMASETATSVMGHFFKTAIGIIFTQAVQVMLIGLLLSAVNNLDGPDKLFTSIGFIVLLLRGPKALREYLYSSGTGGGAMGAMGSAATRFSSLKSLGGKALSSMPLPIPGMGGGGSSLPLPKTSGRSGSYSSR